MKHYALIAAALLAMLPAAAKTTGGIDSKMMERIKASYVPTAADRALRNALAANDMDKLAKNSESLNSFDTDFSNRVETKGITDQKRSGRCWLFTGLNVLRSQMMARHGLPELELSQNYNFFFDQLEKSNLFLQGIIDTAEKPMDDRMVEWLFQHPLSDGGQYTGLSDNIMKYGVVPSTVMVETFSSNNTSKLNSLLSLKLRQWGLELRKMKADGHRRQEGGDARHRVPYAGHDAGRTACGVHLDAQGQGRKGRLHQEVHPAIILPRVCRQRPQG